MMAFLLGTAFWMPLHAGVLLLAPLVLASAFVGAGASYGLAAALERSGEWGAPVEPFRMGRRTVSIKTGEPGRGVKWVPVLEGDAGDGDATL